jgi:hypothetical protein
MPKQAKSGMRVKFTLLNPDGTPCARQPTFSEQAFRTAETNEALREAHRLFADPNAEVPFSNSLGKSFRE